MSNKSRRTPPLGGYLQRAQQEFPDYAHPGTPCDVPHCASMVAAGRAVTWISADDGTPFTVYIRLCIRHSAAPISDLAPLLPGLPSIDVPYLDLRDTEKGTA